MKIKKSSLNGSKTACYFAKSHKISQIRHNELIERFVSLISERDEPYNLGKFDGFINIGACQKNELNK